jgi:ATP-binding cassette subfamily B (MDR/TAP) protein 1
MHQLKVNIALLNGYLNEHIYMEIFEGLRFFSYPHLVCKLNKLIYGLKQSLRVWYQKQDNYLIFQALIWMQIYISNVKLLKDL